MRGQDQLYKIFCVRCEWWVQQEGDAALWTTLAVCPACGGCTDAFETTLDEGFGKE